MNFLLIASTLIASVTADLSGPLSVASSDAVQLDNRVKGWSAANGLLGALNIQNYYPTLSSAISSLSVAAGSISDSDVNTAEIHSFATAIAQLLDDLTAKSGDLTKVGAKSIVANDLSGLGGPAVGIVDDLLGAVSNDCDKVKQLTGDLSAISAGFSSANSAYGVSQLNFPSAPKC